MSELFIPESRIAAAEAYYATQVDNPGWDDVLAVFGREGLSTVTPERAAQIMEVSDAYWDARNGVERQDAPVNEYVAKTVADRGDEGLALFYGGNKKLGLIGMHGIVEPPRHDSAPQPEHTLVIHAGAVDASMMRALYGDVNTANVMQRFYVGTERLLNDGEKGRLRVYVPSAEAATEADSMHAILEMLHPERELVSGDDRLKIYDTPKGRVVWGNAPGIEKPRANTRDTFRFIADEAGADLGNSVVVATNDVYAFQEVDAVHVFGAVHGVRDVRRITFTPQEGVRLIRDAGAPLKQRSPGVYAQELRSLEKSLRVLEKTIADSRAMLG